MDKIARKTQNATKYSGDCENGRRTKLYKFYCWPITIEKMGILLSDWLIGEQILHVLK